MAREFTVAICASPQDAIYYAFLMCLVVLGLGVHPRFPLVVLSNRDEVYDRPTEPAHAWQDAPIFGGKDLEKGGTWLGIATGTPSLSFALVTNVRAPSARKIGRSRGELVRRALTEDATAIDRSMYPAFNLLYGDRDTVFSTDESGAAPRALSPGIHGLSNARVDVPWPKVTRLERALEVLLHTTKDAFDVEGALTALRDDVRAPLSDLPDTGVGSALEHALSAPFLALPGYGTRASSVLLYADDNSVRFVEQCYGPSGTPLSCVDVALSPHR